MSSESAKETIETQGNSSGKRSRFRLVYIERFLSSASELLSSVFSFLFSLQILLAVYRSGHVDGSTNAPSASPSPSPSLSPSILTFAPSMAPTLFPTTYMPTVYLSAGGNSGNDDGDDADPYQLYKFVVYYYLFTWVGAEGVNLLSVVVQRYCTTFKVVSPSGTLIQKLFLFKFLGFIHFYFVFVCTAGFLGQWLGDLGKGELYFHYEQLALFTGQMFFWLMVLLALIGCLFIFGLLNRKRDDTRDPCIIMFYNPFYIGITRLLDAILPSCLSTLSKLLCCPAAVALSIIAYPLGAFLFFWLALLSTCSWAIIVGSLGIPLLIAYCMLPKAVSSKIVSIRRNFYKDAGMQITPALCLACRNYSEYEYHFKYNMLLGVCYDAVITAGVVCLVLLIPMFVVAGGIMYGISPGTIRSVGMDLVGHENWSWYWIISKLIQVAVAVILPLVKLYAYSKLSRLKQLLITYPLVLVMLFEVEFDRLILDLLTKLLNQIESAAGSQYAKEINQCRQQITARQAESAEHERILRLVRIQLDEEIQDIAELLFDFDFDSKVFLRSGKLGLHEAENAL